MDRLPKPSRFNLAVHLKHLEALFVWPAFSPVQAMCNEYVLVRLNLIEQGSPESGAMLARLQEFASLSLDDRERAIESVVRFLHPDDPLHPSKILAMLSVNGAEIYGRQADLVELAAARGAQVAAVTPYKAQTAQGVDLSHILTQNLGATKVH